ncbi:MAG: TlyA family RNA methyltransferase [Clostridia bacterium]|nr:TlyA family RNA methyltransferase [Clostridia bacterium]
MRADLFLSTHGYAKSRTAAVDLIKNGVYINDELIKKPSQEINTNISLNVKILNPQRYVSRGGLKLEAALREFDLTAKWMTCVDLGASTGGFTDCLLQHGADKVYAIDVGQDQLDQTLLSDNRVVSIEGLNVKNVTINTIGEQCDMVVTDLSFISQTLAYPIINDILKNDGIFISLIKPQFEVGPNYIGKNGIVKNPKAHENVISKLMDHAKSNGLMLQDLIPSPIKGGDGNIEYLALFRKNDTINFIDIKDIVKRAFDAK